MHDYIVIKVKNVGRINLLRKFSEVLLRIIPVRTVSLLKLTLKTRDFLNQH